MIFIFHFLSFVAAAGGITAAYLLQKRMPDYLTYFFLFLGVGMAIHMGFDFVFNPKEEVIKALLNFEPWSGVLAGPGKVDFLWEQFLKTVQTIW